MSYNGLEVLLLGLLINFSVTYARLGLEHIVGGSEAQPGEFKYAVSLETLMGKQHCTGGIIGDQFVLTAAHCVINARNNFRETRWTVLADSTKAKVDNQGTRVAVEKVYVPKGFKRTDPNRGTRDITDDIAVLKLREKLGLDSNPLLSKLELATSDLSYVNEEAKIIGYGANAVSVYENPSTNETIAYGANSTSKLRYAVTKVVSNRDCAKLVGKPISEKNLCAAVIQRDPSNPEGVCGGDSGGPLVYNDNVAIGILSRSPNGCREDTAPALYTRVAKYTTFIQNAMDDVITTDMRVKTWEEMP